MSNIFLEIFGQGCVLGATTKLAPTYTVIKSVILLYKMNSILLSKMYSWVSGFLISKLSVPETSISYANPSACLIKIFLNDPILYSILSNQFHEYVYIRTVA